MLNPSTIHVTEIQGLYGPLQVLEGRIQQIWGLQQIQAGKWKTCTGRSLRVHHPGRLNRGAGPDFLEAVLEIDGDIRTGSVEIHLYREDWWRHGHHVDRNYDPVILHVVLFAGGMERCLLTSAGNQPEEWVMGPWLREDLESISGGDPGLFGELAPELKDWMESDDPEAMRDRLKIGADRRWQAKESMARCLLNNHGWDGSLHRMTLFYLGYPYNRKAFHEMADRLPRERWCDMQLLSTLKDRWSKSVRWNSGRPANRPARRLEQYIVLNSQSPQWTQLLSDLPAFYDADWASIPMPSEDSRTIRKGFQFREWRLWLRQSVLKSTLNESLCDRLWVDVFLPLLAASGSLPAAVASMIWFHSPPGPFPDCYRLLLRLADLHIGAGFPLANGWVQGLYWADDQLRMERVRSAMGGPRQPRQA